MTLKAARRQRTSCALRPGAQEDRRGGAASGKGWRKQVASSASAALSPVDGFFERKAIRAPKSQAALAIAMKDDYPFGLGDIWENRKDQTSGEWVQSLRQTPPRWRRSPRPHAAYRRPRRLSARAERGARPARCHRFPAAPICMWPTSTRVDKREDDDPSILLSIELSTA